MKSNETMDHLAERVRTLVGDHPAITEKFMFGGLTFLLNGHILVGCKKDGEILISVGKDNAPAAAARPGATAMIHNGREMTGFFWVEADAIEDDDDLKGWIDFAWSAVSQRPVKEERPPPSGKVAGKRAAARKASSRKS
ncbi:MAG TPA: TfoX/Sxy family protein [Devosia sp.]|jgi:TfoX/Sxy family transcriptional regulator of competence genes|nr:TfoX/Sxy family protein [Devosia sp.]